MRKLEKGHYNINEYPEKQTNFPQTFTVLFIFFFSSKKKNGQMCAEKQTLLSHAEQSWICSLTGMKSTTVNLGGIIS